MEVTTTRESAPSITGVLRMWREGSLYCKLPYTSSDRIRIPKHRDVVRKRQPTQPRGQERVGRTSHGAPIKCYQGTKERRRVGINPTKSGNAGSQESGSDKTSTRDTPTASEKPMLKEVVETMQQADGSSLRALGSTKVEIKIASSGHSCKD